MLWTERAESLFRVNFVDFTIILSFWLEYYNLHSNVLPISFVRCTFITTLVTLKLNI